MVKYQQAIYKQHFKEILGGGRDLSLWHECLITTLSAQPLQTKRKLADVELKAEKLKSGCNQQKSTGHKNLY